MRKGWVRLAFLDLRLGIELYSLGFRVKVGFSRLKTPQVFVKPMP